MKTVTIPLDLAKNLKYHLADLMSDRYWWKDEPRRTYQEDYRRYAEDMESISALIRQAKKGSE